MNVALTKAELYMLFLDKKHSDEDEQLWVWEYQSEDGSSHDLFMDINEPIRFRVIDEEFVDLTPTGPNSAGSIEPSESIEQKKAPFSILVSQSSLS